MELNVEKVLKPIDKLLERLSVDTVFGKPTREGDTTVIPVADVTVGFGYGYGEGGSGQQPTGGEDEGAGYSASAEGDSSGSGGGGGAGGRATPRGYLKITPDGVTYEPIVDQGRLALAGIALSAWIFFWIAKTIRAFARDCECECGCHGKCKCHEDGGEADGDGE